MRLAQRCRVVRMGTAMMILGVEDADEAKSDGDRPR